MIIKEKLKTNGKLPHKNVPRLLWWEVVRAEKINNCDKLFKKVWEIKDFRPYTKSQKSHRLSGGGAIVPPCLFGRLTKACRGNVILKYQTKKK